VEIKTEILAGVAIINLSNGVKSSVGEELTATVNQLLDEGHREFVVNLERVRSLDSAGLGDIVRAYTAVSRRGGKLRLEGLNQRLQDTFGLTKLTRSFETSGYPFLDPFNPNLRDNAWKAAVAGGFLFLVIIVIIIWIWGGSFGSG
jgi:anti-sigma B factor antagonist